MAPRVTIFDETRDTWRTQGGDSQSSGSPSSRFSAISTRFGERFSELSSGYDRLLDRYNISQDVDGCTSEEEGEQEAERHLVTRMFLLLSITSFIASATSFFIDSVIQRWVPSLRLKAHTLFNDYLPVVAIEIFISVMLVWMARLVVKFAPACAGSGIPEVKCMLSGERLRGYLGFNVGLAKAIGLCLASSAGLQVGKEGPFVHIATCISARLITLPMFADFRSKNTRETLLLAGVAVGVGTTFSAPISGVLFAMEMMMPHMFTKFAFRCCFFGAIIGSLVFKVLEMILSGGSSGLLPLLSSDVTPENSQGLFPELLFIALCMLLGMISGLLAGMFVKSQIFVFKLVKWLRGMGSDNMPKLPRWMQFPLMVRDLFLLAVLASSVSMFKVYGGTPMFGVTLPALCNELLKVNSAFDSTFSVYVYALATKWILTVCSLCMPVPSGCVAPVLVLGILTGRIYGTLIPEPIQLYLEPSGDFSEYQARFAIVGAATFAASVCHSMAMVVTVFELLAIPRIAIPLTLSTIVAVKSALSVGPSIFDAIITTKGLPGLPTLNAHHLLEKKVWDVASAKGAKVEQFAIQRNATEQELLKLQEILADPDTPSPKALPIIEVIEERPALLGTIESRKLSQLIAALPFGSDVYSVAVTQRLLVESLHVHKDTSLTSVYLKCHAEHYDRTVMVLDKGMLIGILTMSDLFKSL